VLESGDFEKSSNRPQSGISTVDNSQYGVTGADALIVG
jgi:hypothetical protein